MLFKLKSWIHTHFVYSVYKFVFSKLGKRENFTVAFRSLNILFFFSFEKSVCLFLVFGVSGTKNQWLIKSFLKVEFSFNALFLYYFREIYTTTKNYINSNYTFFNQHKTRCGPGLLAQGQRNRQPDKERELLFLP